MALSEPQPDNIVTLKKPPKDRTAAKRQRQYRQRRKLGTVTPTVTASVTPSVTSPSPFGVTPGRHGLQILTITAAIGLAVVAAFFSITGMTMLFPGAVTAVVAMACAMEAGKLVGAAWLAHRWERTGALLRVTLAALIATLAIINAVGVYGRLSAAHLAPHAMAMASSEQAASTVWRPCRVARARSRGSRPADWAD